MYMYRLWATIIHYEMDLLVGWARAQGLIHSSGQCTFFGPCIHSSDQCTHSSGSSCILIPGLGVIRIQVVLDYL
jgi:hypothetical protein